MWQYAEEGVSKTYLRSPSTSGRSLVMAITRANSVTNVVMNATGELQLQILIESHKTIQKQIIKSTSGCMH